MEQEYAHHTIAVDAPKTVGLALVCKKESTHLLVTLKFSNVTFWHLA